MLVFLCALLFVHSGRAQRVRHTDPVNIPQLRIQLDSARAALDGKNYFAAADVLRKNLDRIDSLVKHDREQGAMVHRQQEEIFDLRQEYQLLHSQYEMLMYKNDVNEGWRRRNKKKLDQEQQLRVQEVQLTEERLWREALIRYVLIASGALSLLIGFLVFRRLQDHRRAMEMKAEIAEARATALEAEKRQGEYEARKRFTRQLIDSQEQERKRIAADLHDGLGQDLLVIKNRVTLARRETERGGDPKHELDEITTAVTSSLQDIRRISRNLRPFQLDRLGLTSTLESMMKTVRDSTGLNIYYQLDNIDNLFDKTREIDIYRIIQESLNNVVKHAEATEVEVICQRRTDVIECTLRDNGKGFAVEAVQDRDGDSLRGFGLQGMRERAVFLDGSLHVTSAPGKGCIITLTLPIPAAIEEETKSESTYASKE